MNQVVLYLILFITVLILVMSANTREGFEGVVNINRAQTEINPLAAAGGGKPVDVEGATRSLLDPGLNPNGASIATKAEVAKDIAMCEKKISSGAVTASFCDAAFKDAAFAAKCGISIESGITSEGKSGHIGGLYINPYDKSAIKSSKKILQGVDTNVYKPSFGSSPNFVVDADSCKRAVAETACVHAGVIGSKNGDYTCAKCFSENKQHAVKSNGTTAPISFTFYTNAIGKDTICTLIISGVVTLDFNKLPTPPVSTVDGMTFYTIKTPAYNVKEGTLIDATVSNKDNNAFLAGYLQSQTVNSQTYMIDVNSFVTSTNGSEGGVIQSRIAFFQSGTPPLRLSGKIPFTFISPSNYDATNCKTGPFITSADSMRAMDEGGGCYSPSATPGNYPLACLQKTFLGVGGSRSGKGYPKAATDMNNIKTLLFDAKGAPRTLDKIVAFLSDLSVQASTGMRNGVSLSMYDWNTISVYMTGRVVANPCDTASPVTKGPLSAECVNFLYTDEKTYTNTKIPLGSFQSLNMTATQPLTCRPEGALNPATPEGLARANKASSTGGKQAVIDLYASTFKMANDSSKSITDPARSKALQDCYGMASVQQKNPEVYEVGVIGTYTYKYNDGPAICSALGAQVATLQQVNEAQQAGAQVCGCGWTTDKTTIPYPMQQGNIQGCGAPPISNCWDWRTKSGTDVANATAHVWCYGPKPPKGTPGPNGSTIFPFSSLVKDGKSWASGTIETWNMPFVN